MIISQLSAHRIGIIFAPPVITHCTPQTTQTDLHSTTCIVKLSTITKSNFVIITSSFFNIECANLPLILYLMIMTDHWFDQSSTLQQASFESQSCYNSLYFCYCRYSWVTHLHPCDMWSFLYDVVDMGMLQTGVTEASIYYRNSWKKAWLWINNYPWQLL